MDVDATTATECLLVCGSFFCSAAVADAAETVSAETAAAADQKTQPDIDF